MYVSSDTMIHPSAGGYSVSSRVCRLDHLVQPDRVLTRIDVLLVSWSAILNLCRHASMILTGLVCGNFSNILLYMVTTGHPCHLAWCILDDMSHYFGLKVELYLLICSGVPWHHARGFDAATDAVSVIRGIYPRANGYMYLTGQFHWVSAHSSDESPNIL